MGFKLGRRGSELAAVPLGPEFGIGYVTSMTVWIAEMHVFFRRAVDLVGRSIVPHPVAPVVGEPQFLRFRMPVEPYGIAHAARENLLARPIRLDAGNQGEFVRVRLTNIAWSSNRRVEEAIGAEGKELASMVFLGGVGIDDDLRFAGLIEP